MAGFFSRIFGRSAQPPEAKESAAGRLMFLAAGGNAAWSTRDYASFAREAHQRNVVAYRAISMIADAAASVRWTAWRGKSELEAHPILDLIRDPNPLESGPNYLRAKIGYLMISGNGFEERVTVGGQPRELYQLRPDRMKVLPGPTGQPRGYEYKVGGRSQRWEFNERTGDCDVRHLRTFNPIDDWYGLSPVEPGAYAVDQHNEAMKWVQSLLQNSARPSGALVVPGPDGMGDDQFHRLKAEIDTLYAGSANAGRPMLLEGGLDWKQMGLSPVDMAILETKNGAARDIALAFGVPPQMLGIPGDNTYSNYQEARLAFWEDTVTPLLDMIAADWTAWLGEPQGVQVKPDYDHVPAIVEKKRALWDMADKATDLTVNERRELKGFKPIEGGDVLLVPMSQISLDAATERLPASDMNVSDIKAAAALAYGDGGANGGNGGKP